MSRHTDGRQAEIREGRSLTPEKVAAIRSFARFHYFSSFVNEQLFAGTGQTARVYRAEILRLYVEEAAIDAKTKAKIGGALVAPDAVAPEQGSE